MIVRRGATIDHPTKQKLLEAGLSMLLERGYHDLGIRAVLDETGVPRGSFYHHFDNKEDFALRVVDRYMDDVHAGLEEALGDESQPPLARVRGFFEATSEKYAEEGYLGCLLGGLGQELSGVSQVFQHRIDDCLSEIARQVGGCLEKAREQGDLPAESDPREMAELLVNCWEGAALRSRLRRSKAPLMAMLDFYFDSATSDRIG